MADEYIKRGDLLEAHKRAIRAYENANIFNASAIREDLKPLLDVVVDAPAADVVEVVRGKPVVKVRPVTIADYHEEIGRFAADGSTLYRKNMVHAEIPYKHCPVCGATLCSRWYNYCGKCGAKMDAKEQNDATD